MGRWLGLPRSLSNIALYGNTCKLTLPLKSIEFKVLCAREVLVSGPKSIQGRSNSDDWQEMKSRDGSEAGRVPTVPQSPGVNSVQRQSWTRNHRFDKARGEKWKQLVQNEVRAVVEEETQQSSGDKSNTVSSSLSWRSMMCFPVHPICTAGVWLIRQNTPFARERGPSSTY